MRVKDRDKKEKESAEGHFRNSKKNYEKEVKAFSFRLFFFFPFLFISGEMCRV